MSIKINKIVVSLFVACILFLFIYYMVYITDDLSLFSLANRSLPLFLLLICIGTGFEIVRRNPSFIWSPLPWFLGAYAIYYGFGPLVYHFGSPETVDFIDTYYSVGESDLLVTNMLNVAGISMVLLGYQGGMVLLQDRGRAGLSRFHVVDMERLLFVLLMIGLPVKYLLVVPYYLGVLGWTLPGSIIFLSRFTSLAIIVLFYLVHSGVKKYKAWLYLLIATEVVASIMMLSKLEVIIVLITIVLGLFLCKPKIHSLVAGGIIIGILHITILTPFVTYGRLAFGLEGISSIKELIKGVREYAIEDRLDVLGRIPYLQDWWARVNYANAQAFVMNAYDTGNPGDSFSLINYVFIPRILYPEKPIMDRSSDFTEMVTGSANTATAPGAIAEAYWNGGWLYVILASLFIGVIFSYFTKMSALHMSEGGLVYLPVAFYGMFMGIRIDGGFVTTYVGLFAQAILLQVGIYYLILPVVSRREPLHPPFLKASS